MKVKFGTFIYFKSYGFKIPSKIINEKEKNYYKHEFIRMVGTGIRLKKFTIL